MHFTLLQKPCNILLPLSGYEKNFSHPYSFHFDASVWWRHSMTALTFPIRLAQRGSGLLISHSAMATVVASVFLGLPLSSTSSFPHPPFLPLLSPSLRWTVQSWSTTHSLVKGSWTIASSHMLLWLFPSLNSKWIKISECVNFLQSQRKLDF